MGGRGPVRRWWCAQTLRILRTTTAAITDIPTRQMPQPSSGEGPVSVAEVALSEVLPEWPLVPAGAEVCAGPGCVAEPAPAGWSVPAVPDGVGAPEAGSPAASSPASGWSSVGAAALPGRTAAAPSAGGAAPSVDGAGRGADGWPSAVGASCGASGRLLPDCVGDGPDVRSGVASSSSSSS
jgi:hypothetical protein